MSDGVLCCSQASSLSPSRSPLLSFAHFLLPLFLLSRWVLLALKGHSILFLLLCNCSATRVDFSPPLYPGHGKFTALQGKTLIAKKNCLLAGQDQEQSCSRIIQLIGCRHHAEYGPIHRKMVDDCPLVIASKVNPFPDQARQGQKNEWSSQSFA